MTGFFTLPSAQFFTPDAVHISFLQVSSDCPETQSLAEGLASEDIFLEYSLIKPSSVSGKIFFRFNDLKVSVRICVGYMQTLEDLQILVPTG